MFTIKFYRDGGHYQRIYEADFFTVLREMHDEPSATFLKAAEITLHRKSGDDIRCDVGHSIGHGPSGGRWDKCIIENAAGRTTEIIGHDGPSVSSIEMPAKQPLAA